MTWQWTTCGWASVAVDVKGLRLCSHWESWPDNRSGFIFVYQAVTKGQLLSKNSYKAESSDNLRCLIKAPSKPLDPLLKHRNWTEPITTHLRKHYFLLFCWLQLQLTNFNLKKISWHMGAMNNSFKVNSKTSQQLPHLGSKTMLTVFFFLYVYIYILSRWHCDHIQVYYRRSIWY